MRIHFLSRGPIDQISGGYLYNRYLVEYLRGAGQEVTYHASIADLTPSDESDVIVVDSLALPESSRRLLEIRAHLVLLLHVVPDPRTVDPDGEGLLDALYRRSRVAVTGDSTLTTLRDRLHASGVDAVKIEPGVPGHWRVKQRYSDRARGLLGVANYVPGKGTARLIRVLFEIRDLPWQMTVRGNTDFDPGHYRSMLALVDQLGLSDRIALLGPVPHDTVNEEMIQADLLVHFSERESYSMVTAEAIASGLPVLSYPTGNAEAFGRTGLVRHLSYPAEPHALRQLIERADDYASMRRTGPRDVRTWRDVGDEFLQWLEA